MANNLPTDIIAEDILHKLPAKSLLRFKCVSKSFKTLISSPNFINHHLRHSFSTANNRFLIVNAGGGRRGGVYIFDLNSPEIPPSPLHLPSDFIPEFEKWGLASCDGLLLIGYIIVNLFTGIYFRHNLRDVCGFGYDPITDDYKLVLYRYFADDDLKIYSLTNKSSHLIANCEDAIVDDILIHNVFAYAGFAAVVNRYLCYWLYWHWNKSRHFIICLDLSTEKLTDVPLPEYEYSSFKSFNDDRSREDVLNLSVFEGCLSVLIHDSTDRGSLNVWVMKEHRVAESWVKLFSVPAGWSAPLCYSPISKSKVLIRKGLNGPLLMWYDVTNKQSEKAEVQAVHRVRRLYSV